MTGNELYERMLNEQFGINIESDADAQALDEILACVCTFSIREEYEKRGVLSIVASKMYRPHILYSETDRYEYSLRSFCRELLPSSMFVGKPVEVETIDDLL